jgi:AmiR/NasT family two-component response regulator
MNEKTVLIQITPEQETMALLRHSLDMCEDKVTQLENALESSRQIGAAIGVLMALSKVSYEEAFAMLRESSQKHNVKLRLVATDVLEQGCVPTYGNRAACRGRNVNSTTTGPSPTS